VEEKLTLKEVATELRITPRVLREMCKSGRIGFVRAGHHTWLFTRKDIDDFLDRNRYQPKTVFDNLKVSPRSV
jgi:excisionase family DNA binding protein